MRQSKYSQEFKDSTVQLILNDGESVVKVAEDLDLNPKTSLVKISNGMINIIIIRTVKD